MYKFKRFIDPINGQERFLNKCSQQGYKLEKVGLLFYKFSKAKSHKHYAVQYIGDSTDHESKEYLQMLKEMGFKVVRCPYNMGKKSLLGFKLRFHKNGAVFKGLNKEILIIESDGQCMDEIDLYNNYDEMVEYTKTERNVLLYVELMVILLVIFGDTSFSFMGNKLVIDNSLLKMLFLFIEIFLLIVITVSIIVKQTIIYRYKKEARIYE